MIRFSISGLPLRNEVFFNFATMHGAANDGGNDRSDGKSDEKDEPKWTDDESLFVFGDKVVEIDGLADFDSTEWRKPINGAGDETGALGHDDFLEFVFFFF